MKVAITGAAGATRETEASASQTQQCVLVLTCGEGNPVFKSFVSSFKLQAVVCPMRV